MVFVVNFFGKLNRTKTNLHRKNPTPKPPQVVLTLGHLAARPPMISSSIPALDVFPDIEVVTLPETNIAPDKRWLETSFLLGWLPGRCYVSFTG